MFKLYSVLMLTILASALHLQYVSRFNYSLLLLNKVDLIDNLNQNLSNYYYGNLGAGDYAAAIKPLQQFSAVVCPDQLPFVKYEFKTNNMYQCVACQPLNAQSKIDDKVLFNLETRQCQVCMPNKTAFCDSFFKKEFQELKKKQNNETFEFCPPNAPYYNPASQKCESCPVQYFFDGEKQVCTPPTYYYNFKAPNVLAPKTSSLEGDIEQIQRSQPKGFIRQCPIQKPYVKNNTCISCQANSLFNLSSQQCLEKCPYGAFYNIPTLNCEEGIFYSDVDATNILSQLNGFDEWKSQVISSSFNSARMIKCSKQTPFEVNGKCISCSGDTPLFSIELKKCTACPAGRYFNAEKHHCLSSYDGSGSLKRVIANIS